MNYKVHISLLFVGACLFGQTFAAERKQEINEHGHVVSQGIDQLRLHRLTMSAAHAAGIRDQAQIRILAQQLHADEATQQRLRRAADASDDGLKAILSDCIRRIGGLAQPAAPEVESKAEENLDIPVGPGLDPARFDDPQYREELVNRLEKAKDRQVHLFTLRKNLQDELARQGVTAEAAVGAAWAALLNEESMQELVQRNVPSAEDATLLAQFVERWKSQQAQSVNLAGAGAYEQKEREEKQQESKSMYSAVDREWQGVLQKGHQVFDQLQPVPSEERNSNVIAQCAQKCVQQLSGELFVQLPDSLARIVLEYMGMSLSNRYISRVDYCSLPDARLWNTREWNEINVSNDGTVSIKNNTGTYSIPRAIEHARVEAALDISNSRGAQNWKILREAQNWKFLYDPAGIQIYRG